MKGSEWGRFWAKQVIYREKPNTCHLNLKGYLHKLKLKVSNAISPMDSKLFLRSDVLYSEVL